MLRRNRAVLALIAEHNPFYLISAACMLLGILLLTNSLSWVSIPLTQLLILIGTLNLYEFLMLALAVRLLRRPHLLRDGRQLLILEAFFLADITFLNAEIATAQPVYGLWINAGLWLLALAKLGIVWRVVRAEVPVRRAVLIACGLAVLFALPSVFRQLDHGQLEPRDFYIAWWLMALLPALFEAVDRPDALTGGLASARAEDVENAKSANRPVAPITLYLALPWLSIAAHLGILHYVYDVRFFAAHAGPCLIGLAIVLSRVGATSILPRKDLAVVKLLLPVVAVLVSIPAPTKFAIPLGNVVTLTPTHLATAAAYGTIVYLLLRRYALSLLTAGVALAALNLFGPTTAQLGDWTRAAWAWTNRLGNRLIPHTATAWGIIGVCGAFFFLTIGAMISLKREPETDEIEPTS